MRLVRTKTPKARLTGHSSQASKPRRYQNLTAPQSGTDHAFLSAQRSGRALGRATSTATERRLRGTSRCIVDLVEQVNEKHAQQWNEPYEGHLKKLLHGGEPRRENDPQADEAIQDHERHGADRYRVPLCRHLTSA